MVQDHQKLRGQSPARAWSQHRTAPDNHLSQPREQNVPRKAIHMGLAPGTSQAPTQHARPARGTGPAVIDLAASEPRYMPFWRDAANWLLRWDSSGFLGTL